MFDTQSPIKRLGIYQIAEFVLCKSAFSLIFDAQSPIKRPGIYKVAEFGLCKSDFLSILILSHQSKDLEFTM